MGRARFDNRIRQLGVHSGFRRWAPKQPILGLSQVLFTLLSVEVHGLQIIAGQPIQDAPQKPFILREDVRDLG